MSEFSDPLSAVEADYNFETLSDRVRNAYAEIYGVTHMKYPRRETTETIILEVESDKLPSRIEMRSSDGWIRVDTSDSQGSPIGYYDVNTLEEDNARHKRLPQDVELLVVAGILESGLELMKADEAEISIRYDQD